MIFSAWEGTSDGLERSGTPRFRGENLKPSLTRSLTHSHALKITQLTDRFVRSFVHCVRSFTAFVHCVRSFVRLFVRLFTVVRCRGAAVRSFRLADCRSPSFVRSFVRSVVCTSLRWFIRKPVPTKAKPARAWRCAALRCQAGFIRELVHATQAARERALSLSRGGFCGRNALGYKPPSVGCRAAQTAFVAATARPRERTPVRWQQSGFWPASPKTRLVPFRRNGNAGMLAEHSTGTCL